MKLQVLYVPDCPNITVLAARLKEALAGRRDVLIEYQVVDDEAQAAARGMTGSPTMLIGGADPFRVAGAAPSISCRLYRDEDGTVSGAPSVAALRAAMNSAQ